MLPACVVLFGDLPSIFGNERQAIFLYFYNFLCKNKPIFTQGMLAILVAVSFVILRIFVGKTRIFE